MSLLALFYSFRPQQWIKNLVLFVPLFFSGQATDPVLISRVLGGVGVFVLISSVVYLLNDLADLSSDRKLPHELQRPLARGTLKPALAWLAIVVLLLLSAAGSLPLGFEFSLIILVYLLINIAYSAGLKQVVPLDIFFIAFGFFLRVIAGKVLTDVPGSPWLLLGTFFIALFLALSKRFVEAGWLTERRIKKRKSITDYQTTLLYSWLQITATSVLVTYALYSIDSQVIQASRWGNYVIYSIVFVAFGLFRYLLLLYQTTAQQWFAAQVIRDPWLWGVGLVWFAYIGIILYGS